MDKSTGTNPVNTDKTRGISSYIKKNLSRDISMFSTCFSIIYYERVTMNNGMDINSDLPVESPALSYEMEQKKELCLRKATETTSNMRPPPFRQNMSAMFSKMKCAVKLLVVMT